MGNNALNSNPTRANTDITTHADDWLWAVFAVMALSALGILAFTHVRRPVGERALGELAAAICFTASIAYFAMAGDLGSTAVPVEFIRSGSRGANWVSQGVTRPTRAIWYARYIDWTITTPLLLLELLLVTGLPLSQIFSVLFFDILMIETGLIGALVASRYKCMGLLCIRLRRPPIHHVLPPHSRPPLVATPRHRLAQELLKLARSISASSGSFARSSGVSQNITPTSEMVAYGVLDILAKPVFSIIHLASLSRLDYARLGMSSSKVSDGAHQNLLNEKRGPNSASATPRASTVASPNAGTYGDGSHFHGGAGTGLAVDNGAGIATVGDGSHFHRGASAAAAV